MEGYGNLTDHKSKSILDKVNPITSVERKLNLLSAQYKKTDFNRYIRYRGKLSLISLIGYFCHTLSLQNHVYKLSAQVARLTTFCIEFSIKFPTR